MDRTIVIADVAHHGTTMVSGLCHILGIPMWGRRYDEEKLEDLDIQRALLKHNEAVFKRIVEQRNAQHSIWGFKRVGAWKWASWLEEGLRNPVYLAIYKDPVSVTGRRFRVITLDKLLDTVDQMKRSIEGIKASGLPVHLLSYQKAIVSPADFVRGLAGRIGVDVNSIQLDHAVAYIQPNRGSPKRRYPEIAPWI